MALGLMVVRRQERQVIMGQEDQILAKPPCLPVEVTALVPARASKHLPPAGMALDPRLVRLPARQRKTVEGPVTVLIPARRRNLAGQVPVHRIPP